MKKLLILDVDETLIHATNAWRPTAPHTIDELLGAIYLRPHWPYFVTMMQPYYDLALWTAASESYLAKIQQHLFANVPFVFTWSRKDCRQAQYPDGSPLFIKSLSQLESKYSLAQVLVVDDRQEALSENNDNLVLMPPFFGDVQDCFLPLLAARLQQWSTSSDVRCINKTRWHLTKA